MARINDLFRSQHISATGLKTSRNWMNLISNNIANINTVDSGKRTAAGNYVPYSRQVPVFSKILSEKFRENKVNGDVKNGVKVDEVVDVNNPKKIFDPHHPAARKAGSPDAGYVYYPGISVGQEMADMRIASATYEANLTVMSLSNTMIEQALSIGRG